jgi:hypothetical protein
MTYKASQKISGQSPGKNPEQDLDDRQREVLSIYHKFNTANQHKMVPIPVCRIPSEPTR